MQQNTESMHGIGKANEATSKMVAQGGQSLPVNHLARMVRFFKEIERIMQV